MTCIVGVVEDGKVWIGCDSMISTGSLSSTIDTKIAKNDEMLFGFTGRVRDIQLIRFGFDIPKQEDDMDDYEYMVTVLSTAVRNRLKEFGASIVKDQEEMGNLGTLIGYRGALYKMDWDFAVRRIESNYYAVGSGTRPALGSLYSTEKTDMTPEDRILLALETAAHFVQSVGGPFTVESS